MTELPLAQLSSDLVEGVSYVSNISQYRGYVFGNLGDLTKWFYEYNRLTGKLEVWREDNPLERKLVFTKPDLYEVSFCFTSSMDYAVVFTNRSGAFYHLYDSTTQKYADFKIEGDIQTPRIALSSVDLMHGKYIQLVIGYIDAHNNLCIRLEDDRFNKAYVVKSFPKRARLVSLGYADTNRFQFEVLEAM